MTANTSRQVDTSMQHSSRPSSELKQPHSGLLNEGGLSGGGSADSIRAALKGTEGYDAQRALVSPDSGGARVAPHAEPSGAASGQVEGSGAGGGHSSPSTGEAQGGPQASPTGPEAGAGTSGHADPATGGGKRPAESAEAAEAKASGGADEAEQGEAVDPSSLDELKPSSEQDPDAGALRAPIWQYKAPRRRRRRKPTKVLGPWPTWVPEPPHRKVWEKFGGKILSPGEVKDKWVNDPITAREIAMEHNAWFTRLDKEQRDAADQYLKCLRGESDVCYVSKRSFPKGKPVDEAMRKRFDEVAANCNTMATRYGAAADYFQAHLNQLNGAKKAKAGKAVSALRAMGTWAAKAAKWVSTGAAIAGLSTDFTALVSAARSWVTAKPSETDEAAKNFRAALVTLVKDVVIVATPPLVSVTLSVANAALCEINPNWVSDMTEGLLKIGRGSRSNKAVHRSAPRYPKGGMVDRINYNNMGR